MLHTLIVLSLLAQAAPPVADAEALAAKADGETLFLQYGAVKADDYPPAERTRLAKALLKGALATRKDAAIAVSLAEKSVALSRTAEALCLLGQLEGELGQREAAAGHFEEALKEDPRSLPALLARAELAEKENEPRVAVAMYERAVGAGGKADVKAKLALARKNQTAAAAAVDELKATEASIKQRVAAGARNAAQAWLTAITAEEGREQERHAASSMAPDGVRQAEVRNFVFTYSAGKKDSREMHAFEDRVERLLEKTYEFVADKLQHKMEKRIPVFLMTRAEYLQKFAGTREQMAGGFWDGHKIVINGGVEMDQQFAEVLVHEYTHAVIDDISRNGQAVPRWINEGLAENMRLSANGANGKLSGGEKQFLLRLQKQGKLPKLAQLDGNLVAFGEDVHVSYLLSGQYVRLMIEQRGYGELLDLLRESVKAHSAAALVEKHFEALEKLETRLSDELG